MTISVQKAELVSLFSESTFYGVYTALFVFTVTVLLRGGYKKTGKVLFAITILMYILSSSHVILALAQDIQAFIVEDAGSGKQSNFNNQRNYFLVAEEFIEVTNCVLADSVLIWRVWVVWGKNIWVVAVPVSLLVGTIITGYLFAHTFMTVPPGASVFDSGIAKYAPPAAALTLCTNILCTCLIAGRIWYMQRQIRSSMGERGESTKSSHNVYRSVILLIAESGFIYSSAWLAILFTFVTNTFGLYIVFDMIAQLTGIIPTLIILLAHLNLIMGNKTHEEYMTTMNFRQPARERTLLTVNTVPNIEGSSSTPLSGTNIETETHELEFRVLDHSTNEYGKDTQESRESDWEKRSKVV